MAMIERLRASGLKAKKASVFLAEEFAKDVESIAELGEDIDLLTDVERGISMEALEYATVVDPEIVEPVLDVVFECLSCEAPKVKWEAARVIGNFANRFPNRISQFVPSLLKNARHDSTVVRWSAGYALGEIVKHDAEMRKSLREEFDRLVRKGKNNGVRNVYLKALKVAR